MINRIKITSYSLLFGIFVLFLNVILESKYSLVEIDYGLTLFNIPIVKLFIQLLIVFCCLFFGIIISKNDNTNIHKNKNQERNPLFYQKFPTNVASIDTEGRLINVSDYWLQKTLYTNQEVIGHYFQDFLTEDSRNYFSEIVMPELYETGSINDINCQFVKKNGEIIDAFLSSCSEKDKMGNVTHYNSVIIDITKQKNIERELKQNGKYIESIFRTSPTGIGVIVKNVLFDVNQKICDMTGFNRFELVGKKEDLLYPSKEEYGIVKNEEFLQIKNKGTCTIETLWQCKNGKLINILLNSTPIDHKDFEKGITFTAADITERIDAEYNLKESEEKYRGLFNNAGMAIILSNFTGEIIDANEICLKTMGYTLEEIKTQNVLDFYANADQRKTFLNNLKKIGEVENFEVRILNKKKEALWANLSSKIIDTRHGKAILSIVQNITKLKKAYNDLKASDQKISLHIENTPLGVIEWDHNFNVTSWNKSAEKILGYFKEEVFGCHVSKFIINQSAKEYPNDLLKELITNAEKRSLTIENITKEGKIILCEWYITPLISDDEKIIGVASLIHDITDIREAEIALKKNEKRYRSLTETAKDAIITINQKGIIISWNHASEQMFGHDSENIINKKINIILPSLKRNTLKVKDDWLLILGDSSEANKTIELEGLHKNKNEFPIELSISSWETAGEIYYTVIIRNITKRKLAEKELYIHRMHLEELVNDRTKELENEIKKRTKAEKKVNRALKKEKEFGEIKSRFFSSASHEFRTPLTAVLSSAELLQRYGRNWTEEKYKNQFNKIINSVDKITNLMDDVLSINKSETGATKLETNNVDLIDLCNSIIKESEVLIKNGQTILFNYNIDLKSFILDKKLINVIILNLLSNAIKYSYNGAEILFTVSETNNTLFFTIADKGIGILEKDMKYLFSSFHRGENALHIQGTGLGLSIVKNAVELHNGKIKIDSILNEGTNITVQIPLDNQ